MKHQILNNKTRGLPAIMQSFGPGFTLIEILIVVAMLAALTGITLIYFSGAQDSALDAKRKAELKQYQIALEIYANNNDGYYPIYTGNAINLCGATNPLGNIACTDDPDTSKHFYYTSNGSDYVLSTELDKPNDLSLPHFTACSSGENGYAASQASGGICPI